MREDKRLLKLAKKVAKLEKELDYADNPAEVQEQIEELIKDLSPTDLFEIDNIITEKHLLY